ncbi:MAG: hypothetical protein IT429_22700 [Gemmataceae bacterium]|nr:hypothetical protein [Gemmataceae bacterium]
MTTATDTQTQWDNETYQEFRRTIVRLRRAAEAAREEEATKRSEYATARQARIKADSELFAAIDRFSAPLPLFDYADQQNEHVEPEPAPQPPAEPITRETSLADLVPPGPDRWQQVAVLRQARLYSVGDLLDRAASTPKKVSAGEDWVDGTATVYDVLYALPDLHRATVLAIGDRIIDAGPLPKVEPAPEPKAKRQRKPQTSAAVKAVDPVQVPANLFPDTLPEQAAKAHAIATAKLHNGQDPEPEPLPPGVTVEALMAAYITHRFANRKLASPPTVKPVEFDGRLWVVVGYAGDAAVEYGFRCLPLVPTITWLDNHPGIPLRDKPRSGMNTHEDYLQFWTGVRVKVGKREHAIDVAGEARTLVAPIAAADPETPAIISSPGQCRVCGCVESNCQLCVERTGEPCSWTSPAKDLCSACLPLIETDVGVLAMIRHNGITQAELSKTLKAGVRTVGQALCLSDDSPANKLKANLRADLKAAAEAWIKDQFRRTDDGTEMMPDDRVPAADTCCRCTRVGGAVVDDPALADRDDDLIPVDNLDMAIADALGLSVEQCEGAMLCGKCLDALIREIGGIEEEPKAKKRKGAKA